MIKEADMEDSEVRMQDDSTYSSDKSAAASESDSNASSSQKKGGVVGSGLSKGMVEQAVYGPSS